MEFLMTYGWAILIMLVVIAVLFYLGVFSQGNIPKRCTLPAGFTCYDYYVNTSGYGYLDMGQAIGRDITVTGVGCNASGSTPSLDQLALSINISTGAHGAVMNSTYPIQCCSNTGEPCKAKLAIRYNYVGSSTNRVIYGDLSGPLENVG
ncbi:MAG: hypothetical protein PHF51_05590 [Candidatus ainarchaeum sp.]|nr:hypothetical protein [Candidatus ainarchaeum sp.]